MNLKELTGLLQRDDESLADFASRLLTMVRECGRTNLPVSEPFEDYLINHYKNLNKRAATAITCFYVLIMALEKIDPELQQIDVEYSGSGDSGQIEQVIYEPSDKAFNEDDLEVVNRLIDELAWDIAYGTNPGFEINEGGQGSVQIRRFDPDLDDEDNGTGWKVTMHHEENIMEVKEYEYDF